MKFEYVGGVLPHERVCIERFEDEVLPYLTRNGSAIGELAMSGDTDCTEVIRRYRQFVEGDPGYREHCFRLLVEALKRAELRIH